MLFAPAFFAKSGAAPDVTAPTITSANTASVNEDATLSHTLTANESVTWSIVGGVDQAQFEISGSTLRWDSNGVQDYDAPADDDLNNTYIVDVRATDLASNTSDQTITVTVNAVAGPAIEGALVKKSSDQTAANYSTATIIDWATASYDSDSFFSGGSPSRLTVPSAFNSRYVIVSACVEATSITGGENISLEILKGGSDAYDGRAGQLRGVAAGATGLTKAWIQCSTPPILVATGDYFEAKFSTTDTSITIEAENSSFAIQVVQGTLDGVMLKKAADQTGVSYFSADVSWDTEVHDTDGYHEGVTNPARITIPSGANGKYGILRANYHLSSGAGAGHVTWSQIQKGNSVAYDGVGSVLQSCGTFADFWSEVETAPVPLTTADYFEFNLFCSDGSINVEQEHSTFSLHVYPTMTGALVKKSADQTGANYNTPTTVTWNTDVYDTDTIHDTGSNTSRFTVPAGLDGRYAIIRANVYASNVSSNTTGSLCILKNGSAGYDGFGGSNHENGGLGELAIQCRTQPVLLTTGDYYEAQLWCNDASITIEQESSSFSIQVLDTA
jgi:hypothetical protein